MAVNRVAGMDAEVAVVGAGVVGSATALELSRRGVAVALLEAEPEPGLAASGTNSGVLHTGFDSPPGELETEMILRSAALRDEVLEALDIPVARCGALMRSLEPGARASIEGLAENARRNGVRAALQDDGALEVPGETITDPVVFTLSLAAAAASAKRAELHTGFEVCGIERRGGGFALDDGGGARMACRVLVNCAGLRADEVSRTAGDPSFEIYPRKGEFLVFEQPEGDRLDRILLPVPSKGTKGVLVFPTLDGKVVAGPTAIDGDEKDDWTVRPEATAEILPKAIGMHPALEGAEQIAAYAGLRPAGRGVNYVVEASAAAPGLVNAAAIRSTGLTASLGIAERMAALVGELGVELGPREPLQSIDRPAPSIPWWQRTALHRQTGGPR
jgi:glycerol-3-phosphate dehydrogenase